ncbi:acetyl-CoA carboxylase biotin carboxyl carrier protein subunit [Streptomyces sp. NBC_01537]|uniref:acetyl-CoA carboxylase biotin carboxyl carrier protein n=1 Tax=Streptomyces sp. NBC_01537 TaxID=2903896 RepID=UPI003867D9FE
MTINSDKKTDRVPPKALNGDARPAPPTVHSALDSVCRSATELAKSAPKPPQRIKLQHGQISVEIEWPQEEQRRPEPTTQPSAPASAPATEASATHCLCAPTVGTFYHSPEPGAPPYVAVGDLVRPGQPVGVLEVMKMMSTIEADRAGRVVEVLVPDAHPVEYQQRLIVLEPLEPPQPPEPTAEG